MYIPQINYKEKGSTKKPIKHILYHCFVHFLFSLKFRFLRRLNIDINTKTQEHTLILKPAFALVSMNMTLRSRALASASSTETCLWNQKSKHKCLNKGKEKAFRNEYQARPKKKKSIQHFTLWSFYHQILKHPKTETVGQNMGFCSVLQCCY